LICSIDHIDKDKYWYDEKAAEEPIRFIESMLVHVEGEVAGKPFILEEFQKENIRNIFGWKIKGTNDRKHRFFYWEVPKGNGKSALLSALTLYMNAVDGPRGNKSYCVAGDRAQARIVFGDCQKMIEENPRLDGKFNVLRDTIEHKKSQGVIHVISAEAYSKHGFRPYFIIFDEMHVQPNRELYDVLTKGLMKVRNSMCGMITTAGEIGTFAEDMHETALSIAKGTVKNDYWYVAIYSAYDEEGKPPDDEKLFDPEIIARANPGYGTIIRPEDFDVIVKDSLAQRTGLASYKQLHLNLWVGSMDSYINVNDYRKCAGPPIDLEKHTRENTVCYGGLDLASTEDLSAFALVFFPNDAPPEVMVWFWCPEATIKQRSKNQNVNYRYWVDAGYIFATPGNVQDKDAIKEFVNGCFERYNIQEIYTDPSFHRAVLGSWIEQYDLPITPFVQSVKNYDAPTKELKRLVMSQDINVGENPVLEWQIDNTMTYEDTNGMVKPVKTIGRGRNKGAKRKKIDGVVAFIEAIGAWLSAKVEQEYSGEIDTW
jgi:phage terminase large subunit-like protein